jgi:hypothetical protein
MNTRLWTAGVLALAMPCTVLAQDSAAQQYQPLFTQEMIEKATPEQAARMRITEERNRAAWDERLEAARKREQAAAQARQAPPAPDQAPRAKTKIYKWVDKDGRVHFGDAPAGQGAKEVEVGGIARVPGNPPPPPSSRGGEKN